MNSSRKADLTTRRLAKCSLLPISFLVLVGQLLSPSISQADPVPAVCSAQHNVGRVALTISNNGNIGRSMDDLSGPDADVYGTEDCFTGERISWGSWYPKHSKVRYMMFASLWIGAVIGTDTLVSTGFGSFYESGRGREFYPDPAPAGDMTYQSSLASKESESQNPVSEQDFVAIYTDTLIRTTRDYFDLRPHEPLFIEVMQRSYAWSYSYAEDFVLFDLTIRNVGPHRLSDLYTGLLWNPTAAFGVTGGEGLYGYLRDFPSFQGCDFIDTLGVVWYANSDGDPFQGEFIDHVVWHEGTAYKSARDITGLRIFETNEEANRFSFNWWIISPDDWGPRLRANYRDFGTGGMGEPVGDANRYYMLSNGEVDFDQAYVASINSADSKWLLPARQTALDYAKGSFFSSSVQAIGPLQLDPGASTSFVFAYIAGENFHTDPSNGDNLPNNPDAWYANVDFSDLAKNAMWAKWIYDNPGIDTDGDGYFGKSRVCIFDSALTESGWIVTVADTSWYEGDGVPDWRAAGPPPAPDFWMEPAVNGMTIRFNGSRSETAKDIMTGVVDFEGYHIWLGRDDRESSYSVIAGYDLEDFDKFVWNERAQPSPNFELFESPFTIEQLRCLYGSGPDPCNDSTFDPHRFTRGSPYVHPLYPDSIFRFERHNFNMSQLGAPNGIHKVYPDEPPPPRGANPDSLNSERYTEDGYLKYYEYEFTIQNLLPTVSYWVNVTAFDFGSPESGVFPLETSKTVGAKSAFPFMADNRLNGKSMKAYVYPNPYRIDGDYRADGYEGRTQEILPNEKVRAIHFANLPPKCTISIFSIDGDLVREIHHDVDPSDPNYLHDEWNLVTRNRQAVVSGLYYWTIEDDNGNVQIGKLAIVM